MNYQLIIQSEEGQTWFVPLKERDDAITIGRDADNVICLDERNISRNHARLFYREKAFHLEDLDSYNGVIINGTLVSGCNKLKESDQCQIGDFLISIVDQDSDDLGDISVSKEADGNEEESFVANLKMSGVLPDEAMDSSQREDMSEDRALTSQQDSTSMKNAASDASNNVSMSHSDQQNEDHKNIDDDTPGVAHAGLAHISVTDHSTPSEKNTPVVKDSTKTSATAERILLNKRIRQTHGSENRVQSSKQTLDNLPQNNLEVAKRTAFAWIIIIILFVLLGINIGIIGMWLFV